MPDPKAKKGTSTAALVVRLGVAAGCVAAGLGLWYVLKVKFYQPPPVVIATLPASQARSKAELPPVRFVNVTKEAGIDFRYVNGAAGDRLLPETMTGGVAIFDYDGDGRQDILLLNARPWPGNERGPLPTMALYRNLGGFKFQDVTKDVGLDVPLYSMGVCVGDIDNDGWPDVFIAAVGGNKLFRNIEGKRFEDVTRKAGVGGPDEFPHATYEEFRRRAEPMAFPSSATFLDYDGDGRLDLLVCHYVTWSPKLDLELHATRTHRTYEQPVWFQGAQPVLYHNVDGVHFEDVSGKAGVRAYSQVGSGANRISRNAGKILGVVTADVNGDGWPDVMMACDTTRNLFYLNVPDGQGGRKFEEMGERTYLAFAENQARGGMGIDWGEYHPGRQAFVITNFAREPLSFFARAMPTRLASATAASSAAVLRFSDKALEEGLFAESLFPVKFGTFFFDYDLDGRLDLLSCNGHIEPDIHRLEDWQTYRQGAQLFWNTGKSPGAYALVGAERAGADLFAPIVGRGAAFGDLDGDGYPDLVLIDIEGSPLVLRNDGQPGSHWIRLELVGDGRRINRSAIGAQIIVEAGGMRLHRQVISGRSYLSQCELPVTVGLGRHEKADRVTILWPGQDIPVQVESNLAGGRLHRIHMKESHSSAGKD